VSAYHSHMGRYALENGPDEPRMVPCWRCGGIGFTGALLTAPCRTCDTDGEIPVDEIEDER
jgi:hypothetical protein